MSLVVDAIRRIVIGRNDNTTIQEKKHKHIIYIYYMYNCICGHISLYRIKKGNFFQNLMVLIRSYYVLLYNVHIF